jgi:hypothetical protein
MKESRLFGVLSIDVPEAWDNQSIYTFAAPEESLATSLPTLARTKGTRPNVVVTRASTTSLLADYVRDQTSSTQQQLARLSLLEERTLTLPHGAAISRTYTFLVESTTVQQRQVFIRHAEWVYCFTFSALPWQFDQQVARFDAIIESATFE